MQLLLTNAGSTKNAPSEDGIKIDTKADIEERISQKIDFLLYAVKDLHEIAAEWDKASDQDRVADSLYWDQYMGTYLVELEDLAKAGKLSGQQRERYAQLKSKLREAMPLIEELNFYRPPVEL